MVDTGMAVSDDGDDEYGADEGSDEDELENGESVASFVVLTG
jgi:hypothetical protein